MSITTANVYLFKFILLKLFLVVCTFKRNKREQLFCERLTTCVILDKKVKMVLALKDKAEILGGSATQASDPLAHREHAQIQCL